MTGIPPPQTLDVMAYIKRGKQKKHHKEPKNEMCPGKELKNTAPAVQKLPENPSRLVSSSKFVGQVTQEATLGEADFTLLEKKELTRHNTAPPKPYTDPVVIERNLTPVQSIDPLDGRISVANMTGKAPSETLDYSSLFKKGQQRKPPGKEMKNTAPAVQKRPEPINPSRSISSSELVGQVTQEAKFPLLEKKEPTRHFIAPPKPYTDPVVIERIETISFGSVTFNKDSFVSSSAHRKVHFGTFGANKVRVIKHSTRGDDAVSRKQNLDGYFGSVSKHPNFVRLLGVGKLEGDNEHDYYVVEDGESLDTFVNKNKIDFYLCQTVLKHVCTASDFLLRQKLTVASIPLRDIIVYDTGLRNEKKFYVKLSGIETYDFHGDGAYRHTLTRKGSKVTQADAKQTVQALQSLFKEVNVASDKRMDLKKKFVAGLQWRRLDHFERDPLFWDTFQVLDFFVEVSRYFKEHTTVADMFNRDAQCEELRKKSWLNMITIAELKTAIEQGFVNDGENKWIMETKGTQPTYLIRGIRNTYVHRGDQPRRHEMFSNPKKFLDYFMKLFPTLLITTYEFIRPLVKKDKTFMSKFVLKSYPEVEQKN